MDGKNDKVKPIFGSDEWKESITDRLTSLMDALLKEGKDMRANRLYRLIEELDEYFKKD